jgi:hypothetical protein
MCLSASNYLQENLASGAKEPTAGAGATSAGTAAMEDGPAAAGATTSEASYDTAAASASLRIGEQKKPKKSRAYAPMPSYSLESTELKDFVVLVDATSVIKSQTPLLFFAELPDRPQSTSAFRGGTKETGGRSISEAAGR